MTADSWPADRCPACGETRGVALSSDLRLCFGCRHEWNPAETFGPVEGATFTAAGANPTTAPPALAAVPDLPAFDPIEQARLRFVGSTVVVHELEVEGTVTAIDDEGLAVVEFGSGYSVTVGPDDFSVRAYPAVDDTVAAAIANIDLTIAAQIVRAGAEALDDTGAERVIRFPPDGFLPPEKDALPVIEHGAAYAIATVALVAGVSRTDLADLADRLETAAEAAKGATDNG